MKWQDHIGLDIGSSTIKLVQLSPSTPSRYRLLALGQIDTPAVEDQVSWDRARALAIKSLVKETKASGNQVAISLPESLVYTRVIEMPYLTEPDLSTTIKFQAEQYIPVSLADVVLKHQILTTPEVGVPGSKMSVLLVAAPNDILARYSLLLSNAGLELVAVETEILSVARAVVGLEESSLVTLMVHLGAESTTLAVFQGSLLVLVQSVNTGGSAIIRSITNQLNLEYKQAEEYIKSYGLDGSKLDGKISVAIKPIIELIVTEIKRVVAFYQTREATEPLKRLVLTGGMSLLPGLVAYFNQSVNLEVQLGDVFTNIDLTDAQRRAIGENNPIFATSVGLALKPL